MGVKRCTRTSNHALNFTCTLYIHVHVHCTYMYMYMYVCVLLVRLHCTCISLAVARGRRSVASNVAQRKLILCKPTALRSELD